MAKVAALYLVSVLNSSLTGFKFSNVFSDIDACTFVRMAFALAGVCPTCTFELLFDAPVGRFVAADFFPSTALTRPRRAVDFVVIFWAGSCNK